MMKQSLISRKNVAKLICFIQQYIENPPMDVFG